MTLVNGVVVEQTGWPITWLVNYENGTESHTEHRIGPCAVFVCGVLSNPFF